MQIWKKLVLCLTQRASLVQLVVNNGLVQVISFQAQTLHLFSRSPLIHSLLVSTNSLKCLL